MKERILFEHGTTKVSVGPVAHSWKEEIRRSVVFIGLFFGGFLICRSAWGLLLMLIGFIALCMSFTEKRAE